MKVRNKLTKETLDIPYSEFRTKFAKEIQDAFESYRKTQLNIYSWDFKDDNYIYFSQQSIAHYVLSIFLFVFLCIISYHYKHNDD